MKRSKPCVIAFNTTTTALVDAQFSDPLEEVERIVLEGDLETGDKTTVELGVEEFIFYGTFNFECQRFRLKSLKVTPTFGAARKGMLTIYYKGEDEAHLKSKTIGTSAALPTPLQARL